MAAAVTMPTAAAAAGWVESDCAKQRWERQVEEMLKFRRWGSIGIYKDFF